MVHVTAANFLPQLADLLRHLPDASFVAIDCEMTGISLPESRDRRPGKAEAPAARYARDWKGVPERYSLLQAGVALFARNPRRGPRDGGGGGSGGPEGAEEEEEAEYVVRTYNFYLFGGALERELTLNPSTVRFLLEHGMDFDKAFREGIPFAPADRARRLRARHFERHAPGPGGAGGAGGKNGKNGEGGGAPPPRKPRIALTRADDISFVARTMAGLREWIDADGGAAPAPPGGGAGGDATATTPRDADAGRAEGGHGATAEGGSEAAAANAEEGRSLLLPPCNAYLRRCLYETIEEQYPGLVLEKAGAGAGDDPAARNRIRVLRLSPVERARRERRRRREAWDALLQEIGFGVVFQALSDRCNGRAFTKEQTERFLEGASAELSLPAAPDAAAAARGRVPLVVHNGLQDLLFLLTHGHCATLPESLEDAKKLIRRHFPLVFDTKVFATEYSDAVIRAGRTHLEGLFHATCREPAAREDVPALPIPPIANLDEGGAGRAHEAAWDAYMTGCVFHSLCRRMLEARDGLYLALNLEELFRDASDGLLREWAGLNMLYVHMSLYTIDLESAPGLPGLHDPLSRGLAAETTFHVSGVTTSVSTRDILQALAAGPDDGEDPALRHLEYDIAWVDDASFFVGARVADRATWGHPAAAGRIASHVRRRLRGGGPGAVAIAPLTEHLARAPAAAGSGAEGATGPLATLAALATTPLRLLGGALGLLRRVRDEEDEDGRANKRRRVG